MEKLLSVVIPVYNGEKTIEQCIKSIVDQKSRSTEIIVVDNNSTDSTEIIVSNLQKKYKQIIYIKEPTKGVSYARNKGIEVANGEYLLFLDADDTQTNNTLEIFYQNAKDSKSQLIISDFNTNIVNYNRTVHNIKKDFNKNEALNLVLSDFRIQGFCWNKLFDLQLIKDNNVRFPTNQDILEDLYFCFTYLKYIDDIRYVDEKLVNYFQYDNSSAMFSANFLPKITAIEVYMDMIEEVKAEGNFSEKNLSHIRAALFLYSLILYVNICRVDEQLYIEQKKKFEKIFRANLLDFLMHSNVKIKYLISGVVATFTPSIIKKYTYYFERK